MATRRMGGVMAWVATLAVAGLTAGTWALAQDGGNAAGNRADGAPATQQSQDQRRNRGFDRRGFDGRGFDGRGFDGRGFDDRAFGRRGPERFRDARHHWHHGWHGPGRRESARFGRAGMRRGAQLAAIRLDAPMLGAFRRLNLSDSQRESVRTILTNARNSARQARGNQARAAGSRQDLLALQNPGDPNHARAVEAVKSRAVDRIQRATQTQQALYNVLTPAQKTQLTQLFAQRRARPQQRDGQPPGVRG